MFQIKNTNTTVTTAEIQSETVCITTAVTDVQKEKSQYDPTESRQEKVDEIADNPTNHTESSTENPEEKSDVTEQTEPLQSMWIGYNKLDRKDLAVV